MSQQNEGQEVRLIQSGVSVVNSLRPIDNEAFDMWVEKMQADMPTLLQEHYAVEHMADVVDAFAERYLSDKPSEVIPGYVVIKASVLTKLTVGALQFDAKVEVIPQINHMINAVGFCPILHLHHDKDHQEWQAMLQFDSSLPYLGRIKVVDFNQLFHQPI